MSATIDLLTNDPRKARDEALAAQRHPEKAHRPDQAQPKKPARLTLQVVGFGGQGSLVEIEAQVAHPMK